MIMTDSCGRTVLHNLNQIGEQLKPDWTDTENKLWFYSGRQENKKNILLLLTQANWVFHFPTLGLSVSQGSISLFTVSPEESDMLNCFTKTCKLLKTHKLQIYQVYKLYMAIKQNIILTNKIWWSESNIDGDWI